MSYDSDRESRREARREGKRQFKEAMYRARDERREWRRQFRSNMHRQWHIGAVSVHLIIGLVVAILGALALLVNLNLFDFRWSIKDFFWPAVFLSIGASMVIEHRSERTWQWGIAWMLVGLWSFAHSVGWIRFDVWDLFWPIVFVLVGGFLIRRALTEGQNPAPSQSNEPGQETANPDSESRSTGERLRGGRGWGERTVRGIGFLSGSDLKPSSQAMERAELFALMGGVKLDLYDAQLVNDAATINVAACMGGIEILVPSDWTVISNVLPLMGAFIDKRRPATTASGASPKKTLTVNGFVLMGGVEIKN